MKNIKIKNILIGQNQPLAIICGPCVIESEDHTMRAAQELKAVFEKFEIPLIFKSSYDKANRSNFSSFRGPGLYEGLRILEKVKKELDLPVVSDVHSPEEAKSAGEILDLLQIPAFLCRQTDLVDQAAKTGVPVSIKKGQFLAPWDMSNVVEKLEQGGAAGIMLVERGTTFGYNNLVSDMRSIPIMQKLGYPVCYDATHSVQLPGGQGTTSGGQREFIPTLAMCALSAGANCLFMEAHPNPKDAKSDAGSVLDFKDLPSLLPRLKALYELINHA